MVTFAPDPVEQLEGYLQKYCNLHCRETQMPTGLGEKKRHGPQRKTSKKSHSSKGLRHYMMPGYTGHIPGINVTEPGLSYMEGSGKFLDKADLNDRIYSKPKKDLTNPVKLKGGSGSDKRDSKKLMGKSQKNSVHKMSAPPSKKTSSHSSRQASSAMQNSSSATHQNPPPPPSSLKNSGSFDQHVSPTPGYTGHIRGQYDLNPGMSFGKQAMLLQSSTWNPNDSLVASQSPAPYSPSYHQKPSGYTGHLPGAIHLEPGISHSRIAKTIQKQFSPDSRSSTSESLKRREDVSTNRNMAFFNTVPSGYGGHIPGVLTLDPGQNYAKQVGRLTVANSNPVKESSVVKQLHVPCSSLPSGYGGHIPGAHLMEPGLSYAATTRIIEGRLHGNQEKRGSSSVPNNKPASRASSKGHPRPAARDSKSSSRVASQASIREEKNSSDLKSGSQNVYTNRGNLPGFTGHIPNSSIYQGLTFGEMTKDFGRNHQKREPDLLVKDLRVRMPG